MNKFVISTKVSSTNAGDNTGADLLSMMKQAKKPDTNHISKKDHENVEHGWASREKVMNMTTIQCNERSKMHNSDVKGWRLVDNSKVYTTFRNGKKVSASGFEGFKLASGDNAKKAPKQLVKETVSLKRKAEESDRSSIDAFLKRKPPVG